VLGVLSVGRQRRVGGSLWRLAGLIFGVLRVVLAITLKEASDL
jgi:hypothetical protein